MTKKIKISLFLIILVAIAAFVAVRLMSKKGPEETTKDISPFRGTIRNIVSTTGTVLPKNRLEIKPPVNGRLDEILVSEGQYVKNGQVLAWMSSTERAALLDAAEGQGEEQYKYWEQVYKPIALLAPIDGQVIVATMQPGQTVTTSDAVIVLSDELIVRAQVDETDIGKIDVGQTAVIILDAYPDMPVDAVVQHIYYESETVNNVTIYKVDLLPKKVPVFFRSGMNATINFTVMSKKDALLIPLEAVLKDKAETYVLVDAGGEEPVKRDVVLGMTDDKNVEIISGIGISDKLVVKMKKFALPQKASNGTNPFMPFGQRRSSR